MKLYTIQLGKWRKAVAMGVPLLDVSLRSGNHMFAPDAQLLHDYKAPPGIDTVEYTLRFKELMRERLPYMHDEWLTQINKPTLAIACYCGPDDFCHRKILIGLFEGVCRQQGVEFEYCGEIR